MPVTAPGALVQSPLEVWARWRTFWLGQVDARPAALLRIALAAVLFVDLAQRSRDFYAFYSSAGITASPVHTLNWPNLSVFFLFDDPRFTLALFGLGFGLAGALALGWRTRGISIATWVFLLSLHNRNPFIGDGGDNVLRLMLFWGAWSDWGQCYSWDARQRGNNQTQIFALPVRLMQLQIAYIYLASAINKHGVTWLDGSAIYRVLATGEFARGLGGALAQYPTVCSFLTYATLGIEYLLPVLLFVPWRRAWITGIGIGAGLLLHAGIFATMRIGVFSSVMPASLCVFLRASWFPKLPFKRLPSPTFAQPANDTVAAKRPKRTIACLAIVVTLVCIDVASNLFDVRSRWISTPLSLLGQSQHWPMFAPDVPLVDYRLSLPGTLTNGTTIDLMASVVPNLGPPQGFRYTRWRKLRETLVMGNVRLRAAFGRYVCRRALAVAPQPLKSFDVFVHKVPLDGAALGSATLSMHQECVR